MLERTDAITNEVVEPVTFVLAHSPVCARVYVSVCVCVRMCVCAHVCVYIYMYIYICVCIYIYMKLAASVV